METEETVETEMTDAEHEYNRLAHLQGSIREQMERIEDKVSEEFIGGLLYPMENADEEWEEKIGDVVGSMMIAKARHLLDSGVPLKVALDRVLSSAHYGVFVHGIFQFTQHRFNETE